MVVGVGDVVGVGVSVVLMNVVVDMVGADGLFQGIEALPMLLVAANKVEDRWDTVRDGIRRAVRSDPTRSGLGGPSWAVVTAWTAQRSAKTSGRANQSSRTIDGHRCLIEATLQAVVSNRTKDRGLVAQSQILAVIHTRTVCGRSILTNRPAPLAIMSHKRNRTALLCGPERIG